MYSDCSCRIKMKKFTRSDVLNQRLGAACKRPATLRAFAATIATDHCLPRLLTVSIHPCCG